ncbi:hypothetical protein [Micromonospora coxensis]|uniref:Uncharacterized protein n=1 Tax=Micromonospora coxensis TaxID=356852 RepID=A0A1C5GWU4_9ACTN|nr:hypothetical protein [Micromonospora coxensis]SCG38228.1 hypothetical protein GA0070614_0490 [Micromonospora coxensis]
MNIRSLRRSGAIVAGLLVVVLGMTAMEGQAAASPSGKSTYDGAQKVLAPCIALAMQQKASEWSCTSAGLASTRLDAHGTPTTTFTPVAATTALAPAPVSVLADDYDTWCESSGTCHRVIDASRYIGETKGNAVYGNSSGVIGSFDVIIRNSLQGRRGRWTVSLIWDLGPSLTFSDSWINCYEVIDLWPDADCGDHALYPGRISSGSWRWNSPTIYGNNLVNSAAYYAAFNTDFTPAGYSARTAPALETARFKCYGSDPCKF